MLESALMLENTLNFLGIEPSWSVLQADAVTAGQTMLTEALRFQFQLISYII